MKRKITDTQFIGCSGTEKCPYRSGFFLVKQEFKKNIGIEKVHV